MSYVRDSCMLLGLAFVACATPSQPLATGGPSDLAVRPGQAFRLSVGRSARIEGTALRITLRSVAEDSRCPSDVQCVWAGNARIVLGISTDRAADVEVSVNTGVDPRSALLPGHSLRVVQVSPEPRSGKRIPPGSYVAHFELTAL